MEYLLALIATAGIVGFVALFVNELMKKDEIILSYQKTLIEVTTELELAKLGLMK